MIDDEFISIHNNGMEITILKELSVLFYNYNPNWEKDVFTGYHDFDSLKEKRDRVAINI